MEKKGGRAVQPSPKGAATDAKKNPDNAGGKLWPRNTRRREPSGGSFPPKNETSRKPNPPRFSKQPRSRGHHPGPPSRKEDSGLEPSESEVGSVMQHGSKKQSLNHLLNFQLAPHVGHNAVNVNYGIKSANRWNSNYRHKYNKEEFLQANCQFIVKSSGDYKYYMNNPDALVNWDLIEQINIRVVEPPACPICLYPPIAAKMTRCGHIYCWSCVLHYLALSEKTWGKCPICYEAIHKKDLKSVVTIQHPPFNINETITFKLMKKLRGSLIAYPVDEENLQNINTPHKMSDGSLNRYCKLLLADTAHVLDIIEREKVELNRQISDEENAAEKCFIEEAGALLNEREVRIIGEAFELDNKSFIDTDKSFKDTDKLFKDIDKSFKDSEKTIKDTDKLVKDADKSLIDTDKSLKDSDKSLKDTDKSLKDTDKSLKNTDKSLKDTDNNLTSQLKQMSLDSDDDKERKRLESSSSSETENTLFSSSGQNQAPSKYLYFYQVDDGQHIYLHTINAKMLEHTFGSLEFAPKTITGKILEKEPWSMTEEVRKRYRNLQHLPITCHFELVEINLNQPIISKETKDNYYEQIQQRVRRRQRRAREERQREKRITEEENRKMGKFPAVNIKLDSHYQFPTFHESEEILQQQQDLSLNFNSGSFRDVKQGQESEGTNSPCKNFENDLGSCSSSLDVSYSGPSFAKMLSSAKKSAPSAWPQINSKSDLRQQQPKELKLINVTGSHMKPSVYKKIHHKSDSEPECEDYIPAPTFNSSLRDSFEVALEKVISNSSSNDNNGDLQTKGGGGKKKKKKSRQQLLFSTNMPYSS